MKEPSYYVLLALLVAGFIFSLGGMVGAVTSNGGDILRDKICTDNFQSVRMDQVCLKDGRVVFTFPKVG